MSEGFGARLRAERQQRRIDLATVAATTKVNAALFRALERDDISRWPPGIFRRSFVRAYAQAIGLDPEATLREFLEQFPDPVDPAVPGRAEDNGAHRWRRPYTGLRLTLADVPAPHTGRLADGGKRVAAVALDGAVVLSVALALYAVLGNFWMSFGIFTLCYYTGATLLLGNTPGVRIFAARPHQVGRVDAAADHYFGGIGAIASVSDPLSSS